MDISVDGGQTWEIATIKHGGWKHGDYSRTWWVGVLSEWVFGWIVCYYVCTLVSRPPTTTHKTKQNKPNPTQNPRKRTRTWSLWEYEIPQAKLEGKRVLVVTVKATDTSYNVQPERIEPYWNLVRLAFVCLFGFDVGGAGAG